MKTKEISKQQANEQASMTGRQFRSRFHHYGYIFKPCLPSGKWNWHFLAATKWRRRRPRTAVSGARSDQPANVQILPPFWHMTSACCKRPPEATNNCSIFRLKTSLVCSEIGKHEALAIASLGSHSRFSMGSFVGDVQRCVYTGCSSSGSSPEILIWGDTFLTYQSKRAVKLIWEVAWAVLVR